MNRVFQFFSVAKNFGVVLIIGGLCFFLNSCKREIKKQESVKVGILVAQTGPMSIEDKPLMEATLMAIDEINASGGLLGYSLEVVTFDSGSKLENYVEGARELLEKDKVVVIFGFGDSGAVRNTRAVVEDHESVLIYPLAYEGGSLSKNIVYLGPAPNQQIIPGVVWGMQNLGRKFFLVGSDAIYSHVVHAIIKDLVYALNGEIVGENYVSVDNHSSFNSVIEQIDASRPNVILNTIEGVTSNLGFFKALREAGITAHDIPTISFDITENTLRYLSNVSMEGDYSVWGYFQTIESAANEQFEEKFFARYGKGRAIDDPMQSIYVGVLIWAQAVREAGSFSSSKVLKSIENQSYTAPSGLIYMDPDSRDAYRPVRIGKIEDKQFNIIYDSQMSVVPTQYTIFRTPQEWDQLIKDLYEKWGRQWFRGKE